MKRRIHLKKRKNVTKRHLFFITFLMVIICVFIMINYINKRFTPILLETA